MSGKAARTAKKTTRTSPVVPSGLERRNRVKPRQRLLHGEGAWGANIPVLSIEFCVAITDLL